MGKTLMARALDLLSRREHSRRELVQRLKPYAESQHELEALLDTLAARQLQADHRVAEAYANSRHGKDGSLKLRQALREKGLDSQLIAETLSQVDDLTNATQLWQRKFGSLPQTPQEKARQIRFLAARGFPLEVIQRVLRQSLDEAPD